MGVVDCFDRGAINDKGMQCWPRKTPIFTKTDHYNSCTFVLFVAKSGKDESWFDGEC